MITFFFFFLAKSLHSAYTYWFLVPICAPFLGAVVGVLMYQLMIGHHLERDVDEEPKKKEERKKDEDETFGFPGKTTKDDI